MPRFVHARRSNEVSAAMLTVWLRNARALDALRLFDTLRISLRTAQCQTLALKACVAKLGAR